MDNTINSLVSQTMATGGTAGNTSVIDKLTNQILATSDPRTWSGQGFGSAQANAADMAKIIAATGATDISQFGKIQVPTDVPVIPKYQYTDQGAQVVGYTDQNGKVVDPSKVTQDENGSFVAPIGTTTAFGNKTTGQAVGSTYGERQTGNAFGGTFAGKGNTGYRVNYDAQGNPQFYTTGASSSDLGNYAPLLALAGLAVGAPYLGELLGGAGAGLGASALDAGMGVYGAGGSTLGSLGALGGVADMSGLGSLGVDGLGSTVAGMGTGTGLTAAGAGGLGGAGGVSSLGGSLGSGLTAAGAGGLGGTLGAAGLEGALGAGLGAGGLAATNSLLGGSTLGSTLGSLATGVGAGALGAGLGGAASSLLGGAAGSTAGSLLGGAAGAGAGSLLGGGLGTALGVSALGNLAGGVLGANAATSAADKQAEAAKYAADLQKQMFDLQNAQQLPYRSAGYNALNQIQGMLPGQYTQYDAFGKPIGTSTGTDYLTHQFNASDFANNVDPGYAFRLQQGQMANQRMANKAGGLLGANAQQGMQDYTQGLASQEYGNAFNRYTGNQTNIYNRLASLAGIGQTGQTQTNQMAQTAATNMGNLAVGSAGAQAAGGIGAANAYGNALGGIGNNFMLAQLLGQKQSIG